MPGIFDRLLGRGQPARPHESPPAGRPEPAPRPPSSPAEPGLVEFFTAGHRACDELWARVEAARPAELQGAVDAFAEEVLHHLRIEEEVLFPAFERTTGMTCGPTEVMRHEHAQMRGVLDALRTAAGSGDGQGVLDQGETLHLLTQQHNMKEEGMLYPMAGAHLGGSWAELREAIEAV